MFLLENRRRKTVVGVASIRHNSEGKRYGMTVVFKHDYASSLSNQDKAIMIVIYS